MEIRSFLVLSKIDHSSDPSFHSWTKPPIKTNMKRRALSDAESDILDLTESGKGRISTISISKTRNRIVRRKNRRENGIRAVFFGSNPHSKGELFSRSENENIERSEERVKMTLATKKENKKADNKVHIDIGVKPLFNRIKVIRSSGAISVCGWRAILLFQSNILFKLHKHKHIEAITVRARIEPLIS